jgi:tetratricopeptide (TPR) repeat protein
MRFVRPLVLIFVITVSLAALLAVAGFDAEADFQEALKALGARDCSTALSKFEAALAADTDNIRYGSEYRHAVIQCKQYDRCLAFFEKLLAKNSNAANAYLNYGFAYVDKIPDAGAITQVILANNSLTLFTKSLEIRPSWIGYYTRGNSYLFWPKVFNRTHLGVADLEEAMKMQKADKKRSYHVRVYISLGDGYWKMEQADRAKATWLEGIKQFPDNPQLKARLAKTGDELKAVIDEAYDPNKRVDTNLQELWMNQ